jgi:diguanylate cyclase (GGDEF)-like protein
MKKKDKTLYLFPESSTRLKEIATRLEPNGFVFQTCEGQNELFAVWPDFPAKFLLIDCDQPGALSPDLQRKLLQSVSIDEFPALFLVSGQMSFDLRLFAVRTGAEWIPDGDAGIDKMLKKLEGILAHRSSGRPGKIWVVQDQDKKSGIRALLEEAFGAKSGISVLSSTDLPDHLGKERPKLLVIDKDLAYCTSWELLAMVRQLRDSHLLPVIVVSDSKMEALTWNALNAEGIKVYCPQQGREILRELCKEMAGCDEQHPVEDEVERRDALTGFYDHEYFVAELEQAYSHFREKQAPVTLCYFEIDQFEQLAVRWEPYLLNALVREVAVMIADIAAKGDILSRFSDKVFCLIAYGRSEAQLKPALASILKKVRQKRFDMGKEALSLTLSIGVASLTSDMHQPHDLLSQADMLAQSAILSGGGKLVLQSAREAEEKQRARKQRWDKLIAEGNFRMVYQPIVELHGDPAPRFEILFRMLRRETLPEQFVSTAEELGVIERIDIEMARRAIEVVRRQEKMGKPVFLLMNVSGKTIEGGMYQAWLQDRLGKFPLLPGALTVALTEHQFDAAPEVTGRFVDSIRNLHQSVMLKQAASGSISNAIRLMREYRPDYLKLDRLFMHRLKKDPENIIQLKSLVNAGQQSGCRIVGAFVDDAVTLSLLWQAEVHFVQGYFIQAPQPTINYDLTPAN